MLSHILALMHTPVALLSPQYRLLADFGRSPVIFTLDGLLSALLVIGVKVEQCVATRLEEWRLCLRKHYSYRL